MESLGRHWQLQTSWKTFSRSGIRICWFILGKNLQGSRFLMTQRAASLPTPFLFLFQPNLASLPSFSFSKHLPLFLSLFTARFVPHPFFFLSIFCVFDFHHIHVPNWPSSKQKAVLLFVKDYCRLHRVKYKWFLKSQLDLKKKTKQLTMSLSVTTGFVL